ncbi:hypothetical protein [Gracilimonas sp.]|uniref:hypothetical protein n=1 Tax=Gracilimonas sp. TaxID=1974203 RepID=UPI003D125A62
METEKLQDYTTDLYALLKHTQKAVKTQKSSSKVDHTKAVDLLHDIDVALTEQLNEFDGMEDLLNSGTATTIKEKLATVSGSLAGLMDTQREDPVSKMLRDDYTALSMIASGYTMLHTAALGAGEDHLAEFTKSSLTTIAALITETSRVMPHVVANELDVEQIAEAAETNTQECWNPETMMAEA